MTELPPEDRQITGRRGLDLFFGVLSGILVTAAGLVGVGIVSENTALNNDLFTGIFIAVVAVLAASLPLLFRWSRRAFTIRYCGMLAVEIPFLCWLVWRLCQERDALMGLLSLFSLFSGSRQNSDPAREIAPAWVSAAPVFIGLAIALAICLWTVIRMRTNRG